MEDPNTICSRNQCSFDFGSCAPGAGRLPLCDNGACSVPFPLAGRLSFVFLGECAGDMNGAFTAMPALLPLFKLRA
jgi:hypothetical protein